MTPDPIPTEAQPIARSTAGMTTKVVKGSLWTLAGQVLPMAFSLVATPFVIRMLGSEGYGVLILVCLLPMYFSFADLGMSIASTKFGSEAYASRNAEKEARIVRTAAIIAICSSLPVVVAFISMSSWIVTSFNVPVRLHNEAALALKFTALTFLLNFLNSIFNSPQLVRLRMDLNMRLTASFRILGIIATPFVLYIGGGIVGAVFVLMIANLLTLVGHLIISSRLLPELRGITIDRDTLRPLLSFGGALALSIIATSLIVNIEKGVLAKLTTTSILSHYSIAFTFASLITLFSSAMLQSLIPAFTQLHSKNDQSQLTLLYSRAIKMNLIWVIPGLSFMLILSKSFFAEWAGEEFGRESVSSFYILAFGIAFNVVGLFPHALLIAAGRTDIFSKIYWLEFLPYVVLVWVLVSQYGAVGAAAAWSIRICIDTIMFYFLAKNITTVHYSQPGKIYIALSVLIMSAPVVLYVYEDKVTIMVSAIFIVSSIAYLILVWKKLLQADETEWLRAIIRDRLLTSFVNGK